MMIDKVKKLNKMKHNRTIQLEDFIQELNKSMHDATRSIKCMNLNCKEKKVIDMEGINTLKMFDSYFNNCDFMYAHLSMEDKDQRSVEGNVFENCTFTDCSDIYSMNECLFINCIFTHSDFQVTQFVHCQFINCTASGCNFTMANFSLSNYKDLYLQDCKYENSLLIEEVVNSKSEENEESMKEKEIMLHLLSASLRMMYDAMKFSKTETTQLDPIAANLSLLIKEEEKQMEKGNLKNLDANFIKINLDKHEEWANLIVKDQIPIPETDWKGCNFTGYNFSDRNLSNIDFTGSSFRGCDLSGCNLTGVNFSKCNLTGVILNKAIFSANRFDNAKLEKITIDKKNLDAFKIAGIPINTNDTGLLDIFEKNSSGQVVI